MIGHKGRSLYVRKLPTFLNLPLEVPFLVKEVLESEVGLVHVMASFTRCLFTRPRGCICSTVESLETRKESPSTDVD